jgi:branched-chain amino acid transport system substrate-binding protein
VLGLDKHFQNSPRRAKRKKEKKTMSKFPRLLWIGVLLIVLILTACAAPTAAPTSAPPTKAPAPAATTAPATAPTTAPAVAPTTAPAAATKPPVAAKKLLVGFTASQTGAQQVASKKQVEGLQLWLDDVNKAGGIKLKDGTVYMPEMKFYDDESKTDRVQALYAKLINEDKADFLLSPYSSGLARAAAVVGEQNNKVMITAGAADDVTMEQGFKKTFQLYTPASRYLTGAADMLMKLDPTAKKMAIVYEKDAFSTSVAQALKPYAESKGFNVVVYEGYDTGTTDFAPFINKISAATPDAILGGGHFADGTTFAKQLFEKKIPLKFVALLVAPPEPTFKDIGDAAQYIIGPSQWEPQVTYSAESAKAANIPYYGPSVKAFTDAYVAKYKDVPSYHSAGGYAQGLLLQKAIEDADSVDPDKVVAALDKMNLMTFYGVVKFSTDAKTHGKQTAHDMVYMQWQKDAAGKLITNIVWPLEAKSADGQLRK